MASSVAAADEVSTFKLGSITVDIRVGNVTDGDSSLIVHWVGSDFDLSSEYVAREMLQTGGIEIQKELNLMVDPKIRMTGGGDLPYCQCIFHLAIPDTLDEIRKTMVDILYEADAIGHHFISISSVRRGLGDFLHCGVAGSLRDGFRKIAQNGEFLQCPKCVSIYLQNEREYLIYKDVFQEFALKIPNAGTPWLSRIDLPTSLPDHDTTREEMSEIPEEIEDVEWQSSSTEQYKKDLLQNEKLDVSESVLKSDVICFLSGLELREIADIAETCRVTICLNRYMRVLGEEKSVLSALDKIYEIFHRVESTGNWQENAPLLWQFKDGGEWRDFTRCAVGEIEAGYQRYLQGNTCCQPSLFIDKETRFRTMDFARNSMLMPDGSRVSVRRQERPFNRLASKYQSMGCSFEKRDIPSTEDEYVAIEKRFNETMPCYKIKSIRRIHNKDLYLLYKRRKESVEKIPEVEVVHRLLFHGTSAERAQVIMKEGFDKRFVGEHGAALGRGIYFATAAYYSHRYAIRGRYPIRSRFLRTVLLVDVVTGRMKVSDGSLMGHQDASKGMFDSCESIVDSMDHPSIFMIPDGMSAYPAYEIVYCPFRG